MKTGKPHKSIENLFREKFRDFEVTPSKGFWPRFEKRLRFREFLRFNPGKFNIYYLGAGLAAITAIGLSLVRNQDGPPVLIENTATEINQQSPYSAAKIADNMAVAKNDLSKGSAGASAKVTTLDKTGDAPSKKLPEAGEDLPGEKSRKELPGTLKIENTNSQGQHIISKNSELNTEELIRPAPAANFEIDYISGCVPLKVSFRNLSLNYDSCMWEFGDGGYSTDNEPVWIFDEDGEFNVKLVVFGDNNQSASSGNTVKVYPLPRAKFEVNAGDPLIPDEQLRFYNYSENSVRWEWCFGDGAESYDFEPVHQYERPGSYSVKLIAVSEYGCVDSLVITNAFGENSCYLKFPNAFIPNEGGPTGGYYSNRTDIQSEVFHPVWSGVTDYNLRIFTRTGLMIFESNDINIGWDGYYRGQKADPGVYIWKVRGVFKNGDPFVKGGDITLLPKK